jgi:hypothetical protein
MHFEENEQVGRSITLAVVALDLSTVSHGSAPELKLVHLTVFWMTGRQMCSIA